MFGRKVAEGSSADADSAGTTQQTQTEGSGTHPLRSISDRKFLRMHQKDPVPVLMGGLEMQKYSNKEIVLTLIYLLQTVVVQSEALQVLAPIVDTVEDTGDGSDEEESIKDASDEKKSIKEEWSNGVSELATRWESLGYPCVLDPDFNTFDVVAQGGLVLADDIRYALIRNANLLKGVLKSNINRFEVKDDSGYMYTSAPTFFPDSPVVPVIDARSDMSSQQKIETLHGLSVNLAIMLGGEFSIGRASANFEFLSTFLTLLSNRDVVDRLGVNYEYADRIINGVEADLKASSGTLRA